MLTDGAASGYDLKKHFEWTFGHFFAAGYGSIYPALSSLAEQDLDECGREPVAEELLGQQRASLCLSADT